MDGEQLYNWFVEQAKQTLGEAQTKLTFEIEPTVTPGVQLARVMFAQTSGKPLLRTDVRPEGIRMHFPLSWQEELSEWLGVPPADAYRLKSNWVNQPSIGVAVEHFDPYFKNLTSKVIEMLEREISAR